MKIQNLTSIVILEAVTSSYLLLQATNKNAIGVRVSCRCHVAFAFEFIGDTHLTQRNEI